MTTQRIEAFSDGVFAIAITLLILEIRLPTRAPGEAGNLAAELRAIWPSYLAYLLSFVMIGIYWVNHHYIFQIYQRTNHLFNLLNVFFLLCISFLPFPTAVLGEHLLDLTQQRAAVTFYALGLFLPAFAWALMWFYASGKHRLIDARLDPAFVRHLNLQYLLSNVFYLLALFISLVEPRVGLAIVVGLTLLYLLPSRTPSYRDLPPSAAHP